MLFLFSWAAVTAEHIIKLNKGFFPESVAYLANFLTLPPFSQWKPSHASPWLTQLLSMVIHCSHAALCNTVRKEQEPHMHYIIHHVCPCTNTLHLWHHMVDYDLYLSPQRAQFPWSWVSWFSLPRGSPTYLDIPSITVGVHCGFSTQEQTYIHGSSYMRFSLPQPPMYLPPCQLPAKSCLFTPRQLSLPGTILTNHWIGSPKCLFLKYSPPLCWE